jgi:hypothetical protein
MDWWVWVLIVVALVSIGAGVRRSRGKVVHPDQSAINAARKRNDGRTGGYGGF